VPYKVRKVKGGYKVKKAHGKSKWSGSRKPLSKAGAEAQARAIYANERARG
jgi:hypothetical protein